MFVTASLIGYSNRNNNNTTSGLIKLRLYFSAYTNAERFIRSLRLIKSLCYMSTMFPSNRLRKTRHFGPFIRCRSSLLTNGYSFSGMKKSTKTVMKKKETTATATKLTPTLSSSQEDELLGVVHSNVPVVTNTVPIIRESKANVSDNDVNFVSKMSNIVLVGSKATNPDLSQAKIQVHTQAQVLHTQSQVTDTQPQLQSFSLAQSPMVHASHAVHSIHTTPQTQAVHASHAQPIPHAQIQSQPIASVLSATPVQGAPVPQIQDILNQMQMFQQQITGIMSNQSVPSAAASVPPPDAFPFSDSASAPQSAPPNFPAWDDGNQESREPPEDMDTGPYGRHHESDTGPYGRHHDSDNESEVIQPGQRDLHFTTVGIIMEALELEAPLKKVASSHRIRSFQEEEERDSTSLLVAPGPNGFFLDYLDLAREKAVRSSRDSKAIPVAVVKIPSYFKLHDKDGSKYSLGPPRSNPDLATSAFTARDPPKFLSIPANLYTALQSQMCELSKMLGIMDSFTLATWTLSQKLCGEMYVRMDLNSEENRGFLGHMTNLNSLILQMGDLVMHSEKQVAAARANMLLARRDVMLHAIPPSKLALVSTNRFDLKHSPPGEFLFDPATLTQARVESDKMYEHKFQAKLFKGLDPWKGRSTPVQKRSYSAGQQATSAPPSKRGRGSFKPTRGRGFSPSSASSVRGKPNRGRGRGRGRGAKSSH